MLEASHPSNPDNVKGKESFLQDKIKIVQTNFSGDTECCSLDATTVTSINYCPKSQPPTPPPKHPSQGGVGRETTVQQYLGKNKASHLVTMKLWLKNKLRLLWHHPLGCQNALQQPQPPTPLPPACIGVKEIKI